MSAPLILWCVIALFANVPTAFSRPRHIGKPVSEVKADEVQKRQSECGNVTNNELKSPRYPSNYPNSIDCVYWVVIPAGKTMNIYFNDFHLEYHSICSYDYLKIANEKDETFGGRNGKYCGLQYGNVSVTGQYAVLTFHSDSIFSRRGYNLTFTFAPVGSNGTQSPPTYPPIGTQGPQTVYPTNPPWYTTAPPNGTQGPQTVYPTNPPWYTTAPPNVGCGYVQGYQLTSPGYPNNYPNGIDCEYWVYIPYGKALRIYFNEFQVESHSSCSYDYLRIANEKNETFGGRNGKYCGVLYGSVSVTGQYAVLTFHSDGSVAHRGYNLTFTLIPTGLNGTQPPPTYPPKRTPATMFPSAGPSPDAKSELQYLIAIVRYLLNQMEYVVNNEVFSVSVRDYEARVKRAITDVHHALRAEGRQKRDVSSVEMISQLEKKADDLIKQLQIKEDRYQRSAPKRKVAIEDAEKAH